MKQSQSIILNNHNFEQRIAKALLTTLTLSIVGYVLMIGSITLSVISRKTMESDTRSLVSEIHTLELSYLEKSEAITVDYAHQNGFVDVKNQTFASVDTAVAFNGQSR